jgi:hypothetical protein
MRKRERVAMRREGQVGESEKRAAPRAAALLFF